MTSLAWYQIDSDALPRGVVVVDATADAAGLWHGPILSVLEEVAERVPAARHPDVVFLGGRTAHPLASILRGLGSDRAGAAGPAAVNIPAQLGRHRLAGPSLWAVSAGPVRPVVLIANGPVIDLTEWAVPEVTAQTLVYRVMGQERISPTDFVELAPDADLGRLVSHLADPPVNVRFGGGDSFAVDWVGDPYRWVAGELTADDPIDGLLIARFAVLSGPPAVRVRRAGGTEHRLIPAPAPAPPPPPALPLTPAEGDVLRQWQRGAGFYCRHCRGTHPPGGLRCGDTPDDTPLFPALRGAPPAPLYLAEFAAGQWTVRPVPRGVVPLPDGRILVRRTGAAPLYVPAEGRWESSADDPGRFVPAGDAAFVLFG